MVRCVYSRAPFQENQVLIFEFVFEVAVVVCRFVDAFIKLVVLFPYKHHEYTLLEAVCREIWILTGTRFSLEIVAHVLQYLLLRDALRYVGVETIYHAILKLVDNSCVLWFFSIGSFTIVSEITSGDGVFEHKILLFQLWSFASTERKKVALTSKHMNLSRCPFNFKPVNRASNKAFRSFSRKFFGFLEDLFSKATVSVCNTSWTTCLNVKVLACFCFFRFLFLVNVIGSSATNKARYACYVNATAIIDCKNFE